MSDKQYDSVLVGYAEDPRHNDEGELMSWAVRFKDTELKDMIEKYATRRNAEGQGGNVYVTMFMSKNGKACAVSSILTAKLPRNVVQPRQHSKRQVTSVLTEEHLSTT